MNLSENGLKFYLSQGLNSHLTVENKWSVILGLFSSNLYQKVLFRECCVSPYNYLSNLLNAYIIN